MRRITPLILGGGPAGSAAAITLARGGAKPLILERARTGGDAICGGFVSWRTLASLDRLGLDESTLRGHRINQVRLFAGSRRATAPLPHRAIGISRKRLDSLLLDKAQGEGAAVERGVTVRDIGHDGMIRLSDEGQIDAESVFLATGKHNVRGITRERPQAGEDQTLGLRVMLSPHPALTALIGSAIELHMFDGGYCGILLNENGDANLCLAMRKSRLTQASGQPQALLAQLGCENPAFGERLAFMGAGQAIDAIAAVPYGWRTHDTRPGLFRLGDQAAVIPSLAGEGNGIALASGMMAGSAWLAGGAAAALPYQQGFAKRTRRPVRLASWLWHRGETPITARLALHVVRAFPAAAGMLAELTRIRD
ncbi:MAG: NAD(P)/FAD-dependent oxidoreductase [Sphingomonadaceae bacterium]